MLQDNLYFLKPISLQINSHEANHKRKEISPVNQTHLWHLRLCHINIERIRRMVIGGLISPLDVIALPVCEPCLEGKMTMRPFKAKGYRAKEVLDLVHTDLCEPMSNSAREGTSILSHSLMITQGTDTSTRCTTSLRILRNSKSLMLEWRTFMVRVSSLYDLIVEANNT